MENATGGKTALGLENNVGASICYLNICLPFGLIYSIIVLVTDKTNKLPRFHAVQSIILSLTGIPLAALYLVGTGIGAAMHTVIDIPVPLLPLIWLLITLLALVVFASGIFAAVKAFQGQIFKLPLIGGFADKFSK